MNVPQPKPTALQIAMSAGFGFMGAVIAIVLGSLITLTTGIPLAGGIVNGIATAGFLTIGLLATSFTGSATLMWIAFSLLTTFTTTLGPPGVYKVVIGLVAGLLWDLIYFVLRQRRIGLYLGALVGSASIMVTMIVALSLGFGLEASTALRKYVSAFWVILAINLTVTMIGVYLGESVYKTRLSRLASFRHRIIDDASQD